MNDCRKTAISLKDFNKNVQKNWKALQFENDFCDMALACEGQLIRTHKVIISSSSPVLKNILKNSQQNQCIYLTGVKYEDLINIVTLIYQGEVFVPEENLDFFLDIAENLELKGFCKTNKNLSNVQNKFMKQSHEGGIESSIKRKDYTVSDDYLEMTNSSMIKEELMLKTDSEKLKNKYDTLVNETSDDKDSIKYSTQNENYLAYNHKDIERSTKTEVTRTNVPLSDDYNSDFFLKTDSGKSATKSDSLSTKKSTVKKSIKSKKFKQYFASLFISEEGFFLCKICNKRYRDNDTAKHHIRSVHQKIHQCEQCEYRSPSPSLLKIHVESIHQGIRHDCDQCDYKAKTKGTLNIHLKHIHKGVSNPCDICDYKATFPTQLKRHRALIHKIGEELLCDRCDYRTRSKVNLTAHVKVKHEGLRELCDKCNKLFSSRDHLRRHIESVHYKVRFQCEHCGLKTTQKGDLTRHVKKVHTN